MIVSQAVLPDDFLTEVYRVPPNVAEAVAVDLFVCNESKAHWAVLDVVVVRDGHKPDVITIHQGETILSAPTEYYIYHGYDMRPTETLPLNFKLHQGDVVRLKASTAAVTYTLMAEEFVTPDALKKVEERLDVLVEDVLRLQAADEAKGTAAVEAGTHVERAERRASTFLRRHPLFDTEAELVNATASILSLVVDVQHATRVESLWLRASSVTGTADVKAEYRTSWDGNHWEHFDDTQDITSSTLTDRANNAEGFNTFPVSAPLNRYIQIRITGVGTNPADTLVAAYLVVREEYADA